MARHAWLLTVLLLATVACGVSVNVTIVYTRIQGLEWQWVESILQGLLNMEHKGKLDLTQHVLKSETSLSVVSSIVHNVALANKTELIIVVGSCMPKTIKAALRSGTLSTVLWPSHVRLALWGKPDNQPCPSPAVCLSVDKEDVLYSCALTAGVLSKTKRLCILDAHSCTFSKAIIRLGVRDGANSTQKVDWMSTQYRFGTQRQIESMDVLRNEYNCEVVMSNGNVLIMNGQTHSISEPNDGILFCWVSLLSEQDVLVMHADLWFSPIFESSLSAPKGSFVFGGKNENVTSISFSSSAADEVRDAVANASQRAYAPRLFCDPLPHTPPGGCVPLEQVRAWGAENATSLAPFAPDSTYTFFIGELDCEILMYPSLVGSVVTLHFGVQNPYLLRPSDELLISFPEDMPLTVMEPPLRATFADIDVPVSIQGQVVRVSANPWPLSTSIIYLVLRGLQGPRVGGDVGPILLQVEGNVDDLGHRTIVSTSPVVYLKGVRVALIEGIEVEYGSIVPFVNNALTLSFDISIGLPIMMRHRVILSTPENVNIDKAELVSVEDWVFVSRSPLTFEYQGENALERGKVEFVVQHTHTRTWDPEGFVHKTTIVDRHGYLVQYREHFRQSDKVAPLMIVVFILSTLLVVFLLLCCQYLHVRKKRFVLRRRYANATEVAVLEISKTGCITWCNNGALTMFVDVPSDEEESLGKESSSVTPVFTPAVSPPRLADVPTPPAGFPVLSRASLIGLDISYLMGGGRGFNFTRVSKEGLWSKQTPCRLDGSRLGVVISARNEHFLTNRVTYVFFWTDTEEECFLEKQRLAAIKNDAKTAFVAQTSHELRTPLNSVIGMANLLKSTKLSSDQVEMVQAICQSSEILTAMVSDVLDISKVEEGHMQWVQHRFNVEGVIHKVIMVSIAAADAKGLDLSLQLPENIMTLLGDELRLKQVLVNLVSNAVKYTPSGGNIRIVVQNTGPLDTNKRRCLCGACGMRSSWVSSVSTPEDAELVEMGASCTCHWLSFHVIDDGIGLTRAQRRYIFEPYRQAEATTCEEYGGTGLGLALAKKLTEGMGGKIYVRSAGYGKGSNFSVVIPFPVAEKQVREEEFPFSNGEEYAGVLVCISQPGTREAIVHELVGMGVHDVVDATTIEEARPMITQLDQTHPVCVLIDAEVLVPFDEDEPPVDWPNHVMRRLAGLSIALLGHQKNKYLHVALVCRVYHSVMLSRKLRSHGTPRQQRLHPVQPQSTSGAWIPILSPALETCNVMFKGVVTRPILRCGLRNALAGLLGIHLPLNTISEESTATIPGKPVLASDFSLSVIVADDNPLNRRLTQLVLERAGHRVYLAEHGDTVLDMLAEMRKRSQRVDLIILDVQMPMRDGLSTAKVLRAIEKRDGLSRMPLIAVTADAQSTGKVHCLEAGFDRVHVKPINGASLLESMKKLCK